MLIAHIFVLSYMTKEDCKGKRHETKVCYFNVANGLCIESDPMDPEHFCAQFDETEMCKFISIFKQK
jgi:hypothetical protein